MAADDVDFFGKVRVFLFNLGDVVDPDDPGVQAGDDDLAGEFEKFLAEIDTPDQALLVAFLELLEAFAQLREPRVAEALEVVALGWIDVVARYEFVNRDAGQQVFRKIFGKVSAVAFFVASLSL